MSYALTSLSAPILDSLTISIDAGPPVKIDIFGGRVEAIRHLTLTKVSLPWEAGGLGNLRNLSLVYLRALGSSVDQLVHIIRSSPGLETLGQADFCCDDIPPSTTPIDLFALTKIHPAYTFSYCIRCILAALRIPRCMHLYIDPVHSSPLALNFIFDSSTDHIIGICRNIIASTGHVHLTLEPSSLIVGSLGSSNGFLHLFIQPQFLSATIPSLVSILASHLPGPDISLEMNHHDTKVPLHQWDPVLKRVHDIKSNTLLGGRSLVPLLSLLATSTDASSAYQWPLPKLHTLVFDNIHVPVADLTGKLQTRYGRRGGVGDSPGKEPIAPLTRLRVVSTSELRPGDIEVLNGILRPNVENWTCYADLAMDEAGSDEHGKEEH